MRGSTVADKIRFTNRHAAAITSERASVPSKQSGRWRAMDELYDVAAERGDLK